MTISVIKQILNAFGGYYSVYRSKYIKKKVIYSTNSSNTKLESDPDIDLDTLLGSISEQVDISEQSTDNIYDIKVLDNVDNNPSMRSPYIEAEQLGMSLSRQFGAIVDLNDVGNELITKENIEHLDEGIVFITLSNTIKIGDVIDVNGFFKAINYSGKITSLETSDLTYINDNFIANLILNKDNNTMINIEYKKGDVFYKVRNVTQKVMMQGAILNYCYLEPIKEFSMTW